MDRGFVVRKPARRLPTIKDVRVFDALPSPFRRGPFKTKSNAELTVNFAPTMGIEILQRFANFDPIEVREICALLPMITLREYEVTGIPCGRVNGQLVLGGTEFHRIREEIVMCTAGKVFWVSEDAFGEKLETMLTPSMAIWMPPFILHSYISEEDGSGLKVLCNTFLYPDIPETSDTYSEEAFRELQANCA